LYQFEMEAWDAAEEMFRESIKISPRWPWYHYHLGRTLEGAGKLAAAIESFKMAVELFPLSGTMNAHLGSALAEASQQEKGSGATQLVADARSRLNLAVDLAPDDDYVMEIARQALAMLDAAKGSAEPSIASEDAAAAARDPSGAATGHSEAR
jgi:tetratricopeptide (TPR) repeat protein